MVSDFKCYFNLKNKQKTKQTNTKTKQKPPSLEECIPTYKLGNMSPLEYQHKVSTWKLGPLVIQDHLLFFITSGYLESSLMSAQSVWKSAVNHNIQITTF